MVKKVLAITFISAATLFAVGSGDLANSGVATEFKAFGGAAGTMIRHIPDLVGSFQATANTPAPPAPKSAPAPGGPATAK